MKKPSATVKPPTVPVQGVQPGRVAVGGGVPVIPSAAVPVAAQEQVTAPSEGVVITPSPGTWQSRNASGSLPAMAAIVDGDLNPDVTPTSFSVMEAQTMGTLGTPADGFYLDYNPMLDATNDDPKLIAAFDSDIASASFKPGLIQASVFNPLVNSQIPSVSAGGTVLLNDFDRDFGPSPSDTGSGCGSGGGSGAGTGGSGGGSAGGGGTTGCSDYILGLDEHPIREPLCPLVSEPFTAIRAKVRPPEQQPKIAPKRGTASVITSTKGR